MKTYTFELTGEVSIEAKNKVEAIKQCNELCRNLWFNYHIDTNDSHIVDVD
jgi:hypothetical protein